MNPFSTRFVKPGALPFLFDEGVNAARLVEELIENQWKGQIIGPHGSGKSTLMEALKLVIPCDQQEFTLRGDGHGNDLFQMLLQEMPAWERGSLLMLDGFEQLAAGQRRRLLKQCSEQEVGVLVTAHEDLGLPTLCELVPSREKFRRLVNLLLAGFPHQITQEIIDAAYRNHQPNLREALFSLYDQYEFGRRG
ncbi:MAG: hypothetical protein VX438_18195 [Planctomycetota bacterium]|nr:hypothetical protein [Planctomycetota bacterium]